MLKGLLKTIGKIYFGHKLVLWMILAVLSGTAVLFAAGAFAGKGILAGIGRIIANWQTAWNARSSLAQCSMSR